MSMAYCGYDPNDVFIILNNALRITSPYVTPGKKEKQGRKCHGSTVQVQDLLVPKSQNFKNHSSNTHQHYCWLVVSTPLKTYASIGRIFPNI